VRNLQQLLHLLVEHDVAFVVIGGFAAVVHGSSRVTQDIDVVFDWSEDNLGRLLSALAAVHPRHRFVSPTRPVTESTKELASYRNLFLLTDAGALDILGDVTGVGNFSAAAHRSIEVLLWGVPCRVLDLDALIDAKRALGREKDREILFELEAIRSRR
jgi:hypothetical protein